jgi:hypothetical protein
MLFEEFESIYKYTGYLKRRLQDIHNLIDEKINNYIAYFLKLYRLA